MLFVISLDCFTNKEILQRKNRCVKVFLVNLVAVFLHCSPCIGRRTLSSSTRWSIDITPILSTYVMLRYLDKPNVDMRSVREQLFVRKQDKVIFDFPWRTILKCGILPPI